MTNINAASATLPPAGGPEKPGTRGITGESQKLWKACQDFEAMFVYEMLKTMRQASPFSGAIKIPGKSTYEMLMDQQIASSVSKKGGGLGLARALYEKMAPLVEKSGEELKER